MFSFSLLRTPLMQTILQRWSRAQFQNSSGGMRVFCWFVCVCVCV
jgi:hypothetical protein